MSIPVLHRNDLPADPMAAVVAWLDDARAVGEEQAGACCLATVDAAGAPDARLVIARIVDVDGVVFCTHIESAKARQLAAQPAAALTFFWQRLMRQVRLRGAVSATADAADALWRDLSRTSRVAAVASDQVSAVADRAALDRAFDIAIEQVDEQIVRPSTWVAYRLRPASVELWHGHPEDRRHDRFRYRRTADGWGLERLMP